MPDPLLPCERPLDLIINEVQPNVNDTRDGAQEASNTAFTPGQQDRRCKHDSVTWNSPPNDTWPGLALRLSAKQDVMVSALELRDTDNVQSYSMQIVALAGQVVYRTVSTS